MHVNMLVQSKSFKIGPLKAVPGFDLGITADASTKIMIIVKTFRFTVYTQCTAL